MLTAATEGDQTVLVAARDLPAGHRLTSGDVRNAHVSADLAPEVVRSFTAETIDQGRVLTSPMAAGEALSTTRVRSPDSVDALEPGMRGVHISLQDLATAGLLHAGSVVDLYSGVDGSLVHAGAVVVQVDAQGADEGGLTGGSDTPPGAVVAVPAAAADAVMAAVGTSSAAGSAVHLVLRTD